MSMSFGGAFEMETSAPLFLTISLNMKAVEGEERTQKSNGPCLSRR